MMRTAKQALTEPPIPEWATNNEPTRQSEIVKQRLAYIKPGENAFNATDMPEELRLNVRGAKLSPGMRCSRTRLRHVHSR